MQDYEKLGAFYIGREFDLDKGKPKDDLVLYDSRDLTTHAVIVGMTGSGKTGLGIGLLEEAAIDGIPAIAIDPKGDLGNLLLTFPELRPADFRPWIDEGEATRAGRTPDAAAAATAEMWQKGLAEWGQDGARIARLRAAAETTIYTPGSTAGRSISVLRSLAAPAAAVRDDAEASRERIGGFWMCWISPARSRSSPACHAWPRIVEMRMCSRDWIGSASTPSRPSRLVAVVAIRSRSSSPSSITAGSGAAKDFRIDTGRPALLPGV